MCIDSKCFFKCFLPGANSHQVQIGRSPHGARGFTYLLCGCVFIYIELNVIIYIHLYICTCIDLYIYIYIHMYICISLPLIGLLCG